MGNYPQEIHIDESSVYSASDFDYNHYYHVGNGVTESNFSDIGPGSISWSTYNTTNESNSSYGDPLFTNAGTDFTLRSTSPAVDTGVDLGSDYDDAIDPTYVWTDNISTYDQDLRGSGWEMGAYILPVPFAPTIGLPDVLSDSSIKWSFTDNADDETGFKLYDNTDSLVETDATANLSYINELSLSENTSYSGRYIKAYNSYGESPASATSTSTYTEVGDPTNLSSDSERREIILSVDTFLNPGLEQSGYYFSNILGENSGWIKTNIWHNVDLSCGEEYNYNVKYRNGEGVETNVLSLSDETSNCTTSSGSRRRFVENNTTEIIQSNSSITSDNIDDIILLIISILSKNKQGAGIIQTSNFEKFTYPLYEGLESEKVRELQEFLATDPDIYPEAIISGYFGQLTRKAVQRFQIKHQIVATEKDPGYGYVGPKTRAKINSLIK